MLTKILLCDKLRVRRKIQDMEVKKMEIKPLAQVSTKWREITSGRTSEYEAGVRSPRRDWATSTEAARENYALGIQEAINQGRFERGVRQAGTQAWQKGAVDKGVSRFASGVRVSEGKYKEGFQPYHETINALTLSPRYPRGDTRNYDRVRQIGEALHDRKIKGI